MQRVMLDGKPVSPRLERALRAELGKKRFAMLSVVDDDKKLTEVIDQCYKWRAMGTQSLYIGGIVYAAEIILEMLGELSFRPNRDQPDS